MADFDDNISTLTLALEAAFSENCSLSDLRRLCKGKTLPEGFRSQVWQRFLGVVPGQNSMQAFNEIFDLPNQSVLREDCSSFVESLSNDEEDKVSIISDLESILTFYCKKRKQSYESSNGWLRVLTPLIAQKLQRNDLYSCFEAVQDLYIPKQCQKNGNPMHLLRLLLLYHEPELCSFLDSHKLTPDLYATEWFSTIFASCCNLSATLALWDCYFVHGDPFLLFFLALVLLVNAKDDIMVLKGKDRLEIIELITSIPKNMEAADIPDFCSLALLYCAQTPMSLRKNYHQILFGEASDSEPSSDALSQALCLPVSVPELLTSCGLLSASYSEFEGRALRFFLVDCRPAEQYNAGHLPTAFHLDCNLLLSEPQAFAVAVQALLSAQKQSIAAESAAGGEHLVFLGSGREAEDQYVHMVVAFFLQRHVQFVGLVCGGFYAVHEALTTENKLSLGLADHNATLCLVCQPENCSGAGSLSPESLPKEEARKSNFFGKFRLKSSEMKEKLLDYIVNPTGGAENQGDTTVKSNGKAKSSGVTKDRSGKLYRNLTPVFTIDDDQDEDGISFEGCSEKEDEPLQGELVSISSWLKKPEVIQSFRCQEVKESGHVYPSYLLVTGTHLYALREVSERSGFARLSVTRSLLSIMKITSKKKYPEFITFKYGTMQGEDVVVTDMDRFLIPQAGDATKLVKQQIVKLIELGNGSN